jgi:hypothetical protein
MVDLLKRLRDAGDDYTVAWGSGELYDEAADELERLTRELEEARKDAERLMFATGGYDGFVSVDADKYEYAAQCAAEAGRDEPNAEDEINGVRRLIDAAMSQEKRKDSLDHMARDADELGLDY